MRLGSSAIVGRSFTGRSRSGEGRSWEQRALPLREDGFWEGPPLISAIRFKQRGRHVLGRLGFAVCLIGQVVVLPKTHGLTDEKPKNLLEIVCDEKVAIQKAKGQVERNGLDLLVWLPGHFPNENAVLFRNPVGENTTTFVYCGGANHFDLVMERFDHDAPMLYLVEKNGRRHLYHLGDDFVYSSADAQNLLSFRRQTGSTGTGVSISVSMLRTKPKLNGSREEARYQEDVECKISSNTGFLLNASKLTNETAVVEALEAEPTSTKDRARPNTLGKLHLTLRSGKWRVSKREGVFGSVACHSS